MGASAAAPAPGPGGAGTAPTLLLAVHGTRDPRGTAAARALARAVARRTGAPVRLGFADVLAPDVGEAAAAVDGPLVVVPAFLAAGYHVRVDIPGQLARVGRAGAPLTPALGGDDRLITAAARRLRQSGRRPGDAVVLAAAGSSDPAARAEVAEAAARLAAHLDTPVAAAYVATARPSVPEAVARLRAEGAARVAVAAWLLAPGLFHQRLSDAGADTVAAPLCPDPAVVDIVAARYHAGVHTAV
ncbi:sirohydrochlorin chelatase [Streptomonospora sp. S1-112]|uniref:Sirohydrochlorin chelatase n=1 Tax=Streptomonospora mangrovi TaxID=2883123 RepID=A0A9X3NJU4_9ACTN|nr:CbiX/SirB N-terminal domain-containing protein [Streptomonospora mangrovi]MDA0563448.1 sirohydrochlorin chelatase [Streptomonospora mangrovi]